MVACIWSQFFRPPTTLTFLHLTAVLPVKQSSTPLPPEPGFSRVNCSGRYCSGAREDMDTAPWLTCLHAHSCHFHHRGENDLLKLACWCSEKNEGPRKNRPAMVPQTNPHQLQRHEGAGQPTEPHCRDQNRPPYPKCYKPLTLCGCLLHSKS